MKWFAVILVAAGVVVLVFVLGSSDEPAGPRSQPSEERPDRSSRGREKPSVVTPKDVLDEQPVEPVAGTQDEPPPEVPVKFAYMKSLTPETRIRLEQQGSQETVNGFMEALRYTPSDDAVEQIVQVLITAEQNHLSRLTRLDHEKIWNMSDPAVRAERSRRERDLHAARREEQYESLKPHVKNVFFDPAFEKWSGASGDEDR